MACYEMVRYIKNLCRNNQMRDVSIEEVSAEDPETYVRGLLRGRQVELTTSRAPDGSVTVYASCDGLIQEFVFTPV